MRFSESEGVDVWTPGKVTQLKNVTKLDVSSTTTDDITDTVFGVVPGSTVPPASAIMFGTSAGLFAITWYYNSDMTCYQASLTGDFTGSYSVQSLATNPTRTELFVYLTTTDGSYIVRNSSFVAGIGTTTTTLASQVSFGLSPSMEYVKGRLIVVGDQSVYEVDAYADSAITALPDALYTLPGTAYFSDVSISEYSGGFYVGYN